MKANKQYKNVVQVWAGYTMRAKKCAGFFHKGAHSAHIKDARVSICEIEPEDRQSPELAFAICLPKNLIGGTVGYEFSGNGGIPCKSRGEAEHLLAGGFHGDILAKRRWRVTPEAAVRDALEELSNRNEGEWKL